MKPRSQVRRPHGYLRASQAVTTFGPGAMMDLPQHGVLVAGLELWGDPVTQDFRRVAEPRLARRLAEMFNRPIDLYTPPEVVSDGKNQTRGVRVWKFPEWFVTTRWEDPVLAERKVRSRPLVHWRTLQRGKYQPERDERGAKLQEVTPVRFVQACPAGHISDIQWVSFVHAGSPAKCVDPRLWLDEEGTVGDLSDITVRCATCDARRKLITATQEPEKLYPLGECLGKRPWLGAGNRGSESCVNPQRQPPKPYANRLLIRSASNAWFPSIVSVITIPEADAALRAAVEEQWGFLQIAKVRATFDALWMAPPIQASLGHFGADAVWAEVQRRDSGVVEAPKTIKRAELETLLASREEIGDDRPGNEFFARRMALPADRGGAMAKVERVVLLHRLREVLSLVGFSRFEAQHTDVDGELALGVRRAEIALEPRWMPTIENRGEGFFVSFDRKLVEDWAKSEPVKARRDALRAGFDAWQEEHPDAPTAFPGVEYIMLHSLAHLLITAVSLECGYSSSSIRERVYVNEIGYGVLLYTGTFDSEGTLGGLVEAARRLPIHLRNALDLARLCSNDPVCAQHAPAHTHERRHLHGAACHGCLLISETCCERRNEFLDRALVVDTVDSRGAAFFSGG